MRLTLEIIRYNLIVTLMAMFCGYYRAVTSFSEDAMIP